MTAWLSTRLHQFKLYLNVLFTIMKFNPKKRTSNIILMASAFVIVSLILWNTNIFFKKFKEEERLKMENWATAQSQLLSSTVDQELGDLPLQIMRNNTSTPMILVTVDGSVKTNNMSTERINDAQFVQKKIAQFGSENTPITIQDKGENLATLYYGNSEVITKLKFYPIALLLIIFLFGAVIVFYFKTNKVSEQNKVWAGMAKETAHQIATPLSSLLGWNEFLKEEGVNPEITVEIAKDIQRLQTITERFSKVGSVPDLELRDIVQETQNALEYLKRRSSKLIQFSFHTDMDKSSVLLSPPLYNWTIENLVKNGIDAMKGKGSIHIGISEAGGQVNVQVTDTGHGIPKSDFQSIFNPGVTSKKRGWGLGLSLVKRIVEEYHNGKIKVLSSNDNGTVMQISLKTQN